MSVPDDVYTTRSAIDLLCRWNDRKEIIVDDEDRYTGARLNRESRSIAQGLLAAGIRQHDTVALMGVASCRFYAAWFAVHKLGGVTCNIHVLESAVFLTQTLEMIGARALICSSDVLETALAVVEGLGTAIPIFTLGETTVPGVRHSYPELVSGYPAEEPEVTVSASDDALIILSSGSTGTPKGIRHCNGNVVRWLHAAPALFGAVSRSTRFLVMVGTSFAAWPFSSIPIIFAGGCIVLLDRFSPEKFCRIVEQEKITMTGPVPTMIRMLTPEITRRYDLSFFEMVLCAGEPPSAADIERVLSWADTDIRCLYLASESAPGAATFWELNDLNQHGKAVCAGKPVPGADVRIIDPEGDIDEVLGAGDEGEIALRGPTIANGYLGQEALTARRFIGGWWRSGDLGVLDEDGYLHIRGRTDNMINTGGIKVHGEEVEAFLLRHPHVAQVAVIGVADEKWGHRIEAHVACSLTLQADTLQAYCVEEGLAPFKRPKRFVFHESLPLGATGKLDRVALRRRYAG